MIAEKRPGYVRLTTDVEDREVEDIVSGIDSVHIPIFQGAIHHRNSWTNTKRLLPWLAHVVLLSISLLTLLMAYEVRATHAESNLRHVPLVPGEDDLHTVRFDGGLGPGSVFKGPPNKNLDAAWEEILDMGIINISPAEFASQNASRFAVQTPPALGSGYLALPEFVHQMHCLYFLWQHIRPDYYVDAWRKYEEEKEAWLEHMDHCTEELRQKIMCDADTNLITYNWVRGFSMPRPNFNVQHTCRNFEAVLQWTKERQVDSSRIEGGKVTRAMMDGNVVEYDVQPPFDPTADR